MSPFAVLRMLLPSPRSERRRRASLLLLPGVLLAVIFSHVCASFPAGHTCPLDCAREGRHSCKPGSSHCGPCLSPLEENKERRCVIKKRHHPHGEKVFYPDLDEEIDYIHSVIEKQQISERPSKQHVVISLSIMVGLVAVILAAVCFVRLKTESHLAKKVDYPAFGGEAKPPAITNGTSVGDKTLAQSAQMYHYQHQKQQMLSMGKHNPEPKVHDSEVTSDEEEVGGDFTVYECPGLAPTGEMEVKNPLFDDSTLHYQGNHK
ncbi:neural proliferation differentiation and control protein 1-like [Diretmus argenteus]